MSQRTEYPVHLRFAIPQPIEKAEVNEDRWDENDCPCYRNSRIPPTKTVWYFDHHVEPSGGDVLVTMLFNVGFLLRRLHRFL